MQVAVVGAGLGGLAAAVAVQRAGHDVTVFERSRELRETGAGIALLPNGVLALDALGLGGRVRAMTSAWTGAGGLRDFRGRTLLGMRQADFVARVGAPFVVVPRSWLHRLLVAEVGRERVRAGVAVGGVHDDGTSVRLETDCGPVEGDLVVAADGLGSGLRAQLFPSHPGIRGSGEIAVRAIAEASGLDPATLPSGELLDHRTGDRFGCMPMATGGVHWYSTWRVTAPAEPAELHRWLLARRADWHPAVPALVAATPPAALHVDETAGLAEPLPSLVSGRVALLGDAAHAMTPDTGQGGCQALEDAVVLGTVLADPGLADPGLAGAGRAGVAAALGRYDEQRRPRTTAMIIAASRANRMATLTGPAAHVRNALLRLVPSALSTSALARQFGFAAASGRR